MRVLLLGGTRFLGKAVACILVADGHQVTTLSRHVSNDLPGSIHICGEIDEGLKKLGDVCFDIVLDFINYGKNSIEEILGNIKFDRYVLISTVWMPRLWHGKEVAEFRASFDTTNKFLPRATTKYLIGKCRAEDIVLRMRGKGMCATILRLPITLGEHDHTDRVNFYRERFADNYPVILVNGGLNFVQICEKWELANVMIKWLETVDLGKHQIWDALPGNGEPVFSVLERMARDFGTEPNFISINEPEIRLNLTDYLKFEPFWRETALSPSASNIYNILSVTPKPYGHCSPRPQTSISKLREEEISFIENRDIN